MILHASAIRLAALFASGALMLSACTSETVSDDNSSDLGSTPERERTVDTAMDDPASDPSDLPVAQEETCSWDDPVFNANAVDISSVQEGELQTVVIGSWQHTHIDEGAGYVPVDTEDIRFVFPAADRLLYCQHVPGITEYAEFGADVTWEDTALNLPGGAPGYIVEEWADQVMVWTNRLDGSRYLLQRR